MNREALIEFIEGAFDGVSQPGDITLHVAEAHDSYDYDHDAEHRGVDYFGPWQRVPAVHIKKCRTALSYVDKVGMRYYLPAFMVWYLKNFGDSGEVCSDQTLYALDDHPDDTALREYHKDRFSLFLPEQMRACALFVKFCAEDATGFADSDFAVRIYERYWWRYEKA
ncbi:MAG: hypothetical protein JXA20_16570 [Spirochaetes bacterium]|nr:hypothetical protein [Spirochaetota bacterium]